MSTVPEKKKITAEEYFKLTENLQERTELIDGEIVYLERDADGNPLALAAPTELHQILVGRLFSRTDSFILANKGTCRAMISPFDVVLNSGDVVQPDFLVICDESKRDGKRCNGAPDWIVEITSRNRSNDYMRKLRLYRESGVREYWIVDTDDRKVWVYHFEQHPNVVEMFDWGDTIPVRIYDGKLAIRIADLV